MPNICVYCGSSLGRDPSYASGAKQLGALLVDRGYSLIYGGARVGTMGALADSVLAAGGAVEGVIPGALVDRELAHDGLTRLHVVSSMHERKQKMAELADAFIALPGGYGTLEEIFEALTWSQLGLHSKPCGLLSIRGYYDALSRFLDHTVAEGFVPPERRHALMVEEDAETLLDRLEESLDEKSSRKEHLDR